MSWRVDGKYYHDYDEYQSALARKRARESSSHYLALEQELRAARKKHENAQAELKTVKGNLQEQRLMHARLEQSQREMQRVQSDLLTAQNHLREQMQEIDETYRDEINTVLDEMSQLETRTQAEQARMKLEFEAAQEELMAEMSAVDNRLKEDLQNRMATQGDQMARSRVQIEAAQTVLADLSTEQLENLDLIDRHSEITSKITAVQQLSSEDSQAALAVGLDIFEKSRSMQTEAQRRQSMLEATREAVLDEVNYLSEMVRSDNIQKYFKQELVLFQQLIHQLKTRTEQGYQNFRDLSVQGREDQRLLSLLRRQAYRMVSSQAVLEEQQQERINAIRTLVLEELPKVYGTHSSKPAQDYLIPDDLKSPVRVQCEFAGAKVQLVMDIDGSIQMDGYGHDSNVTCRQQGERTFDHLKSILPEGTRNSQPDFSQDNRQAALTTDIKIQDEWTEVHGDLMSELEQTRRGGNA